MKQLLPSNYKFDISKLSNIDKFDKICTKIQMFKICFAMIVIPIIQWFVLHFWINKKISVGDLIFIIFIFFFLNVCGIGFVADAYDPSYYIDDFQNSDFKTPIQDSNLLIRCVHSKETSTKPTSVDDENEYPYELYADFGGTQYLGKMQDGKFEYANTYPSGVFYKYMQYISKHHLEDKFKDCMYFKQDSKYLCNQQVQWILTNKRDIVLHLNDDAIVKESRIVRD